MNRIRPLHSTTCSKLHPTLDAAKDGQDSVIALRSAASEACNARALTSLSQDLVHKLDRHRSFAYRGGYAFQAA